MVINNADENLNKESVDLDEHIESEECCSNCETQFECDKEEAKTEQSKEELLEKELEELRVEHSKLKDENKFTANRLKVVEDKYSSLFNEYENYRKRTAKEKENIFNDSCGDVLKEFLPVLDNLERAIDAGGSLEELKIGVEMTLKGFKAAFEKLSVEEISTNEGFDPNYHNAVMHVEDKEYGQNQIVEVFQKGYKREEKVIRHSMVKVAN